VAGDHQLPGLIKDDDRLARPIRDLDPPALVGAWRQLDATDAAKLFLEA